MEITGKNVAIAIVPVLITAMTSIADNSLRWRAEMEQKQFDRQTRIIDKIMEVPTAEKRLAVADFYLEIGVFTNGYRKEIITAIDQAQRELTASAIAPISLIVPRSVTDSLDGDNELPSMMLPIQPPIVPLHPIPQTREDIKSIFTFNKPLIKRVP
jgi:hypothetical protein